MNQDIPHTKLLKLPPGIHLIARVPKGFQVFTPENFTEVRLPQGEYHASVEIISCIQSKDGTTHYNVPWILLETGDSAAPKAGKAQAAWENDIKNSQVRLWIEGST